MVIPMPTRPGRARKLGPNLQHVTQLRVTPLQRRYLLFLAARDDVSVSEVLRGLVDRSLASAKPLPVRSDEDGPDEGSIPLRVVLEGIDDEAIEQLAERHGA
jgi:hypothetical protein